MKNINVTAGYFYSFQWIKDDDDDDDDDDDNNNNDYAMNMIKKIFTTIMITVCSVTMC